MIQKNPLYHVDSWSNHLSIDDQPICELVTCAVVPICTEGGKTGITPAAHCDACVRALEFPILFQVNLLKAFTPFEPGLWLALLFCLVLTSFLLWIFEPTENQSEDRKGTIGVSGATIRLSRLFGSCSSRRHDTFCMQVREMNQMLPFAKIFSPS